MQTSSTLKTPRVAVGVVTWLLATFLATSIFADPFLNLDEAHDRETLQAVHQAQQAVDRAWTTFHKAALGGTLASPVIQGNVEQALHEARGLLVKARETAERGDCEALASLLKRIHELSERAIQESREQKL